MNWLLQDVLHALRLLRMRWGVTTVAIVVLGLGISLSASMYAIIQGVVLTGPDYDGIERILSLRTTIPQSQFNQSVRIHDYLDWREQQTVFDEMAAYFTVSANVSGTEDRAESYRGVRLTASTFALVGKQALIGRTFTPDEDLVTDQGIIILGYHVWQNRFGGDREIIGKTIRVNARSTTVVGVMPQHFRFPELHDVWLPLGLDPTSLERRDGPGLRVLGKLPEGTIQVEAETQLTTIARRLAQQYPEANKDIVPIAEPWMDTFVGDDTRGILNTMFAAVIGVLLIACANVANLLFAVTIARGKELAIRTALGATRRRVLRQLLTETLVLAFGGAALGLILTKFSLDLFTRVVSPLAPPPWMVFDLNPAVLLFVLGITFFAAIASGVLPALHATKGDIHSVLKDQVRGSSSHGVSRWSTGLVVLEVALSCALLVGAGLTVRSTLLIAGDDFGLDRRNILTARIGLPSATYADSASQWTVTERLHRELEAVPGVRQIAITSSLPVLGTSLRFYGVGDIDYADDSEYPFAAYTRVSPEFFDIIGVPILSGRGFNIADAMGTQRVTIVNERFVERNWPGEDALGKQVRLGRSDSENPWLTVVGVVRTFEMTQPDNNFGGSPPEGMFVPISQEPVAALSVMLRADGSPLSLTAPLYDLVNRIDPDIPVTQLNTLERRVDETNLDFVILSGMFVTFGIVALLLASLGLYAVMAFSVSRRTAEVGIRMALGADAGRIIRLVLSQGARPVAIGVAIGLVLAVFLGKALSTILFNVSAVDPFTFVAIPILLTVVSGVALFVPANRASRVPPVIALRAE